MNGTDSANLSDNMTITIGIPNMPILLMVNNALRDKFYPLTVVLWIYLVIGVLGNGLVMFVYWARKNPVREDRFFIPLLALVDLISCVVSSGTGIYAQTHPLVFVSDIGCKLAAFLGILFAGVSANFLIAIAIERYLKLCRGFSKQLTIYVKKLIIIGILIFGLALSVPALAIYRAEQVPMTLKNGFTIQTWKCIDTKDEEHAIGHMIYKSLLFVVTIIRFVVLIVCYGRLSWIIFRQRKILQRMGSVTSYSSTSFSNDAVEGIKIHNHDKYQLVEDNKESKEAGTKKVIKNQNVGNKHSQRKQSVASSTGSTRRRGSIADRQGVRLTIIFILITLIYIITYGPKVWLMVEQTRNRNFWSTVSPGQLLIYRFLHSFYIFNNIVNPIVFIFLDRRFRTDCKKRFTRCE